MDSIYIPLQDHRTAEINRTTFYRYYDNQYDLLSSLENEMFDKIRKSTYECKNDSSKESELRYCFLLYGYSGIFDYWLKNGMKEAPKEIAAYTSKLRHDLIDKL